MWKYLFRNKPQQKQDEHSDAARMMKESGCVTSCDRLVQFLYILSNEYIPPCEVDKIIARTSESKMHFANGWLANWAIDASDRIDDSVDKIEKEDTQLDQLMQNFLASNERDDEDIDSA